MATNGSKKTARKPLVVIVEGPAGSGKTTLCDMLRHRLGAPIVAQSLSIRTPSDLEAPIISAVNDYSKALQVMADLVMQSERGVPDPIVIVDRLVVSQMVYQLLRESYQEEEFYEFGHIPMITNSLLARARFDFQWRRLAEISYDWADWAIKTLFVIVLPTKEQLTQMRYKCRRDFPWSADLEVYWYHQALLELSNTAATVEWNPATKVELILAHDYLIDRAERVRLKGNS